MTTERAAAFARLAAKHSDLAIITAHKTGYNVEAVSTILAAASELQGARIQQLLEANNSEVERRRAETARADAAERRAAVLQRSLERLEHAPDRYTEFQP